jgi:hypothetical protein
MVWICLCFKLPVLPNERQSHGPLRKGKGDKMADERKSTVAPSSHTRFVLKFFCLPSSAIFLFDRCSHLRKFIEVKIFIFSVSFGKVLVNVNIINNLTLNIVKI